MWEAIDGFDDWAQFLFQRHPSKNECFLCGQQSVFGIFTVSTSSKIASLFTHHDVLNAHKILGISCLLHYLLRFFWLVVYGDMFFRHDSWLTWIAPLAHVTLSCSSFIFPVPLHRYGTAFFCLCGSSAQYHFSCWDPRLCWNVSHSPSQSQDRSKTHHLERASAAQHFVHSAFCSDLLSSAFASVLQQGS